MTRKEQLIKEMEVLRDSIAEKIAQKQPYSQRQVSQLALLFHERDKESDYDTESMAVSRGIHLGMVLILNILDNQFKEEK